MVGPLELLHFALRVGIGKAQIAYCGVQARAVFFPLHVSRQLGKRQHWLGKPAGQVEAGVGHGQAGLAAALGQLQVQVQAGKAGRGTGLRRERRLGDAAFDGVGCRGCKWPGPAALHGLHHTHRLVRLQRRTQGRVNGQALGQLAQHRHIKPVGTEFAARQLGALGITSLSAVPQGQARIAAGPTDAFGGLELQAFGAVFVSAAQVFDRQAARGAAQHLLLRALPQVHIVEQHVRSGACDHSALDVHPGAQAATPLADVYAYVQVRAQLRPVQAVESGVPLALPVLPAPGVQRPQRLGKHALQVQAFAPMRWRVGVDAQRMGEVPVTQHHIHVRQL